MKLLTMSQLLSLSIASGMSLLLSGCDIEASEVAPEIIKPVKLFQIPAVSDGRSASFLAKIDATERATLSFQVGGEIQNLHVRMGEEVKAGQILATLDKSDLELISSANLAQYELSASQWKRAKTLYKQKLISADRYDREETNYQTAQAEYQQSLTDLGYTDIIAPFDGIISYSHVKQAEVVAPKQPILNVINNDTLDVSFSIPVEFVKQYPISVIENAKMTVQMDTALMQHIPGTFKDISTQPDPDTNSYLATLTVIKPTGLNLLTGMTGQVWISESDDASSITLPQSAWINKSGTQGEVWVMEMGEQRVKRVSVSTDSEGHILQGLRSGDWVVTAGVETLKDNQQVKAWVREAGI